MLFADDLIIIADSLDQLQERYLAWEDKLEGGGAKVNTDKTEIRVSRRGIKEEAIMLSGNGQALKQVASFRYLGVVITEVVGTKTEKNRRSSKNENKGGIEKMELIIWGYPG